MRFSSICVTPSKIASFRAERDRGNANVAQSHYHSVQRRGIRKRTGYQRRSVRYAPAESGDFSPPTFRRVWYRPKNATGTIRYLHMSNEWLFAALGTGLFVVLVYAGIRARRWIHDASDFLLGGREVGTPLNVFGVAAIGFAGSSVALVPGMAVLYGFWPAFLNQLTFSIGGLMVYGFFLAPIIRRCGAQTLPEWLEVRFDRNVRLVVTIGTVVGLAGIMANNVASIAAVVTGFVDIPPVVAISIIFACFLVFSLIGGFWAITVTDFIQLLLALVAVPLILALLFTTFGDFRWVSMQQPDSWFTGSAGTLPILSPRFPSIFTSILLFASFLVWGNNYYWLRSASCRTESAARNSFVLAGALLAIFVYAPLLLIGIYVRAAVPEIMGEADFFVASTAYGVFLRSVPLFFSSVLLLVPLAAGISTATTAHMGAVSVVVRDVYHRRMRPEATPGQLLVPSKVVLLVLGVLVWLLCFYPGGPLILFAFANAWLGPPALLIVLGLTWRRLTAAAAFWSTVTGVAVMGTLTVLQLAGIFSIDRYMHVGVVGFVVSLCVAVAGSFLSQPRNAGSARKISGAVASGRVANAPVGAARSILECIEAGFDTLAEITDLLEMDAADTHAIVEALARDLFIRRLSPRGLGFYAYRLEDAGRAVVHRSEPESGEVPAVPRTEAGRLRRDTALALRQIAGTDGNGRADWGAISSLRRSALVARLARDGLCRETGFWRRNLAITDEGRAILARDESRLRTASFGL